MPRKGTRTITVDGRRYRYTDSGVGATQMQIVVESEDAVGRRLVARFISTWVLTGEREWYVSKKLVRMVIVEALRRGWRPDEPGTPMQLTQEQLCEGDGRRPRGPEPPAALLQAVLAALDDDAPRLVLADWLMERGSRRGELIALQCGAVTAQSQQRAEQLLKQYWRPWTRTVRSAARRWRFARGFIEWVFCFGLPPRQGWEQLHREEPVRQVELSVDVLPPWLLQPTTRELLLHGVAGDAGLQGLCAAPHLGRLRDLAVERQGLTDRTAERLAGAGATGLERLNLKGNPITEAGVRMLIRAPSLSGLRELEIDHEQMSLDLRHELRRWREDGRS